TGDLSAIGSREALLDVIGCRATPEACCGAARETAASDRASLTLETISGRVSTESTRLGRDVSTNCLSPLVLLLKIIGAVRSSR
ncbi:MAG: hypothetical protein ACPHK1_10935, partial [Pseudohongiellaceae bacterium]